LEKVCCFCQIQVIAVDRFFSVWECLSVCFIDPHRTRQPHREILFWLYNREKLLLRYFGLFLRSMTTEETKRQDLNQNQSKEQSYKNSLLQNHSIDSDEGRLVPLL
jgi:hypothetical protein